LDLVLGGNAVDRMRAVRWQEFGAGSEGFGLACSRRSAGGRVGEGS